MTYRVKVDFDKKISEKFSIKSSIFLTNVDFFSLFKVRRVTFKGDFWSVCLSPEGDKVPRNFFPIPYIAHFKTATHLEFCVQMDYWSRALLFSKKQCSIQSSDNSELTFLATIAALQVTMSVIVLYCNIMMHDNTLAIIAALQLYGCDSSSIDTIVGRSISQSVSG